VNIVKIGAILCATNIAVGDIKAQSIPNPIERDAQRIQDREAERQREREEALLQSQITPPNGVEATIPEIAEEEANGRCVSIKEVNVAGLTLFDQNHFNYSTSNLISDCTNIAQINNVLRTITNEYIAKGYVTSRAFVGPQELNDGVLEIIIVEGQIEGVKSSEESGYNNAALKATFPNLKDKALNLRDLEQGVDQLSRLQSFDPKIDIEPGKLPGSSTVIVNRSAVAPSIRPSLSLNNDGTLSTGRIQSNIGVDVDNLFGRADYLSLYFSRSVEGSSQIGTEGFGGFFSVPQGYWTLSASAGRFSYESVLDANGQLFANDGVSWNAAITIDRLLYRDSKTKFSVSGGLSVIDTANNIQGIRLSTSSFRLTSAAIDWHLQRRFKQGLLFASLGLKRGLNILGAETADLGPGGASTDFRVLSATVSYRERVEIGSIKLGYSALVRAQSALDPVFSANRFSIGGSSTVRGFRDDGISGRHGVAFRQQADFPLKKLFKSSQWQSQISGFAAYDAGGIFQRNGDQFERGFLHSATLGLRFSNRLFGVETSVSRPLSAPSFVERKDVEFAFSMRIGF